jgi:hypothetical protein
MRFQAIDFSRQSPRAGADAKAPAPLGPDQPAAAGRPGESPQWPGVGRMSRHGGPVNRDIPAFLRRRAGAVVRLA